MKPEKPDSAELFGTIISGILWGCAILALIGTVTSAFDTTTTFGEFRSMADRVGDVLAGGVITIGLIIAAANVKSVIRRMFDI